MNSVIMLHSLQKVMGETCSMHGELKPKVWSVNLKGRDYLGDISKDGKIILKWVLDWIQLLQDSV